eukprot:5480686-Karenia_brevis.AAC.1
MLFLRALRAAMLFVDSLPAQAEGPDGPYRTPARPAKIPSCESDQHASVYKISRASGGPHSGTRTGRT